MKPLVCLAIACALVLGAQAARAESRSVLVLVKHDKDGKPQVAIRSDDKRDRREAASIEETSAAVKAMRGWGSVVHVFIVSDKRLAAADSKTLKQAVADNAVLELTYLREGSEVTQQSKRLSKPFIDHYLKTQGVELRDAKARSPTALPGDAFPLSLGRQCALELVREVSAGRRTVVLPADELAYYGGGITAYPKDMLHTSITINWRMIEEELSADASAAIEFELRTGKLTSSGSD